MLGRQWFVLVCLGALFVSACSPANDETTVDDSSRSSTDWVPSYDTDEPLQRGATRKQSDQFSNIVLYTQHGKPVHFYDDLIKDKAVMINLMYTTCPEICPINTARLVTMHGLLEKWVGHDITMLSLSIDPVVDTPERLARYWEVFGSKPGWLFLTGDYDEIDQLRYELGVYDLDPILDADKTQHSGILTFGNDRTNRWTALPILMDIRQLAGTILRTTWDDQWHGASRSINQVAVEPEAKHGRGIIKAMDTEKGEVVIEHEDIPGMMMAMTMSFDVADAAMLDGLSPGQSVNFDVTAGETRFQILAIDSANQTLMRGRSDYVTYCAPCHGTSGNGDGPMAELLDPKPARHSDSALMNALSDETLFRVIKDGGPAVGKSPQMAAWGDRLSDETIRDLVTYVRSLALNPQPEL